MAERVSAGEPYAACRVSTEPRSEKVDMLPLPHDGGTTRWQAVTPLSLQTCMVLSTVEKVDSVPASSDPSVKCPPMAVPMLVDALLKSIEVR